MSHVCSLPPISVSLVLDARRPWTGGHAPRVLVCCCMFRILTWIFSSHSLEQLEPASVSSAKLGRLNLIISLIPLRDNVLSQYVLLVSVLFL